MSVTRRLHDGESFAPGVIGIFVNPFFLARRGLHEQLVTLAPRIRGRTLDVGCGQKPYRELFAAVTSYVGLELDTPENRAAKAADVYYDGSTFPFGDDEFDSVVASQVLEHVFEPDAFLSEICRVLKPGGSLLVTVPFVWDEHEQPNDYARYSSFGLHHVLERNGFRVMESHKSVLGVATIFQLINALVYKQASSHSRSTGWLAAGMLLMAPLSALGWLLGWLCRPESSDLYLDNVVLACKEVSP